MAEKAKPEKEEEIELAEIVTQTTQGFKLPDEEVVDINGYLAWLGNQLLQVRKAVA